MAFLHPSQIVDRLNITPGTKVADFGCGSGHFTVEMARRTGKSGVVYAFDVQEEVLSALKSKIALEHLSNVEMRRADLETSEGTQLAENFVDFVLFCNFLFQIEHKEAPAKEAFRILKAGGRVAVIDWKPDSGHQGGSQGGIGPEKGSRMEKNTVVGIFSEQGFAFDKEFETDDLHYGIIFKKSEA